MAASIFGMIAETSIHVGIGRSDGAIDLPVAREGGTGFPFAPGSGVKGALRDHAHFNGMPAAEISRVFGHAADSTSAGNAGQALIGDMRLLLLPVRALTGVYRWLTCPLLLERLVRDLSRAGRAAPQLPQLGPWRGDDDLHPVYTSGSGALYLEERVFSIAAAAPPPVIELVEMIVPDATAQQRVAEQLAIVSDEDFGWFAQGALPVTARNVLSTENTGSNEVAAKQSTNLWYEECLPPDTVMTLMIADRANSSNAASKIEQLFQSSPYLQIGGNETIGQGWMQLASI